MIALICLFFPAVLGVGMFERWQKTNLTRKQWLYRFCANALFINCICFCVKRFLLNTAAEPLYTLYADVTPSAALNYMIIAVPTAALFAFLQVAFAKTAKITVEDDTNG